MKYISVEEYLMGRATLDGLPDDLAGNVNHLIVCVNSLLEKFGEYRAVSSGYRRPEDNAKLANPKPASRHLTCEAVDLVDPDEKLKAWIKDNLSVLEEVGLYMEHTSATPTWVHLQTRAPKSGRRVFLP